jgi:hypothetical protein
MLADKKLGQENRRRAERYRSDARIKWSYFNKDRFYDAKVSNFSQDGIYFETPHTIKPGTTILIRLETLSSNNMKSAEAVCLRTVSLADVKWCTKSSTDDDNNYGVGARHLI